MMTRKKLSPLALVLLLSGGFFVLFIFISALFFFQGENGSTWSTSSERRGIFFSGSARGSVGVLEIKGVIMESKKTLKQLKKFEKDDRIKALVVRLDSPGGAVAPSQEIYDALKRFPKPVVASMGSIAASGGYYIAMGAKQVFANPGTITGSIGVIMQFVNLKGLLQWAKVERYSIKTGAYKDAGAEYREMSPKERALFQEMVDDVLAQFKRAVAEGRKLPMSKVDAVADGRIMSGQQAKKLKLVDELGGIEDAIGAAAKLAGLDGEPNVIYPDRKKPGLLELLLNSGPDEEATSSSSSIAGGLLKAVAGGVSARLTESAPGVYWLWDAAL